MSTSGLERKRGSRSVKVLRRCRPVLAAEVSDADQVLQEARRRIGDLAPRVAPPPQSQRSRLEGAILPVAALYLVLADRYGSDRALGLVGKCVAADANRALAVIRWIDRTPLLYPMLRLAARRASRTKYAGPAWEGRLLEASARRIRLDVLRCYYWDTFTALGVPELTGVLCRNDDILWGDLRHIEFSRTGTLGLGCDRCDFCFERRGTGQGRPVRRVPSHAR